MQSHNSTKAQYYQYKSLFSIFGEAVALQKMREGADPIMRIVLPAQGEPQPPIALRHWIVSPLPSGILLTCICAPELLPYCLPLLQAPREPHHPPDHQLLAAQPGAAGPPFNRLIDLEQPFGHLLLVVALFQPKFCLPAMRLFILPCPVLCRGDRSSPLLLSLLHRSV